MGLRFLLPAIALAAVLAIGKVPAGAEADDEQIPFSKLSGQELVQRLLDEPSRPRAFYELWRRDAPDKDKGFDSFAFGHDAPAVVVCPQEKGQLPIYLVLYDFLRSTGESRADYPLEKPEELFPSAARKTLDRPAIEAFTASGRRIQPFGGNNVLDGFLADVNADGLIERVEVTNYGVKGVEHVQVLTVSTVKAREQPLFSVVLNWGAPEWTFRLTEPDGSRFSNIEAGPRTVAGFRPKAVWKWDPATRKYVGPKGQAGDHFRVIDTARIWRELQRLQREKLSFPKDPDAVSQSDGRETEEAGSAPPGAAARAGELYRYRSLRGASQADLMQFMARGRSEYDRELKAQVRERLPADFWTMDAKSAALALLNENRSDTHRAHFQVSLDDRAKTEPPIRCTIAFSNSSARCYNAVDARYFLRVDPQESYLAYVRAWSGGVVFYNAVHDQPAFDLRLCPLSYEDARKIADVIWWLDRARSRSEGREGGADRMISTGDGSARVTLRADGRPSIERSGILWAGFLAERWSGNYDFGAFLNFTGFLLREALPQRLGNDWSRFEPKHDQNILARQASAPAYSEEERKRLRELAERFLGWFTPEQDRISFSIVAEAAQLATAFGLDSALARLREIEAALPAEGPKKRSYEEVSKERSKLPYPFEVEDRKARKEVEQRRAVLQAEIDEILASSSADSADHLRAATAFAVQALAVCNDAEKLQAWATSQAEGQQWAMQRLALVDRKRYAEAVEARMRQADGTAARQFFAELKQADPARAEAIARALPPDRPDALFVSAFLLLREAGSVPDETQRLATIMQVMHDPKSGWEERGRAIALLVPSEAPLRYPGREIEDALLKLLEPGQADENLNVSLERACRALALRGRTDLFDRMAQQLDAAKDPYLYHGLLGALTHLAQADRARLGPLLRKILEPHLARTNKLMSEVFWAIWSADLRQLLPELERLATQSPEDYEDRKASGYGGEVTPVLGRFHLARKFVSLWRETDPPTRARLLVALAIGEGSQFVEEPRPERLARLKAELNRVGAELSTEAKAELATFLDRLNDSAPANEEERWQLRLRQQVAALARRELGL